MFEGDVLMTAGGDGGGIEFVNGQPIMSAGLRTAAFLSLFGGNHGDDGRSQNKKTWWGNIDEENEAYKYIGRFWNLVQGLPLTSNNLRRLENAALADLDWMKTEKIAQEIIVETSIPYVKILQMIININSPGKNFTEKYLLNWQTLKIESIL